MFKKLYLKALNRLFESSGLARSFAGATVGRLTQDWLTSGQNADEILRWALPVLRDRSRDLAKNNDYAKRFLSLLEINIVGAPGIKLQAQLKNAIGKLDSINNDRIEKVWAKLIKKKNLTVEGKLSFRAFCQLVVRSTAQDGECFVRIVKNYPDNETGFSLQIIEPEQVDCGLNTTLTNGNKIVMGIEKNGYNKPLAYWVLNPDKTKHTRVDAGEMIHVFSQEYPSQSRGIPWFHSALIRLRMLGAFEEAAIVNARIGASKVGFFKKLGDGGGSRSSEKGEKIKTKIEPGTFDQLPAGWDFESFNPDYPNEMFGTFVKATLRGVSAGLNISYNELSGDLESVNYNSLRMGAISDRDGWQNLQQFFAEEFCDEVFESSMKDSNLTGLLNIPFSKFSLLVDNDSSKIWQFRGWAWVDPLKEIKAYGEAINLFLMDRGEIVAGRGKHFPDVIEKIRAEQELISGLIQQVDPKWDKEFEETLKEEEKTDA